MGYLSLPTPMTISATCLRTQGRLDEAISSFEQALYWLQPLSLSYIRQPAPMHGRQRTTAQATARSTARKGKSGAGRGLPIGARN